ncbi:MAG: hypothetical protein IJT87_09250 [Ruminiclostridium sp.]|nr:hypothetical protein [Ruminiclostridium sp.]
MKHRNKMYISAAIAAILMLSGCSDISQTLPPITEPPAESTTTEKTTTATTTTEAETTTTTEETTTTAVSFITTAPPTEAVTDPPETETVVNTDGGGELVETYKTYEFSDAYNDFISKCVFVGDSICSGLKAYDILPASQVVAQGNVAARNIFDFTFKVNGAELSVLHALVDLKPEYVVFSMGMNDVNMTSQQAYCENYDDLLSQVETFLPDATLIVCAVTPVLETSNFTSNENIDSFNIAIREYLDKSDKWYFAEISHDLKNSHNGLKSDYNGGDGIHLAPDAYRAILYQLCERMVDGKIYDLHGELEDTEPAEATETAQTEAPTDTEDLLSGTIRLDDEE